MIRVLHVLHSMNSGGIESFLMNVFRRIDKEEIQFDFLLFEKTDSAYEKEIEELGGCLYFIPSRRAGYFKNKKALFSHFRNHPEYNIVHMHVSCLSYVEPLFAAKQIGVPVRIIHSHSSVAPGSKIHLLLHYINKNRIDKLATDYYSCSDFSTKWLYSNTKVYSAVTIIKNGIESEKFIYNENTKTEYRRLLNIDNDNVVLIHIGRFSDEKNHDFLIDVFNDYKKKDTKSVLILAGDGEKFNKIKNKVEKLGLKDSVRMLGNRFDVSELLQASDVYLLPSFYEGFPVSLVEAQATGIPCIFSNTITKTAEILPNTMRLSINKGTEEWTKAIEKMVKFERIIDANHIVRDAGFDITKVADSLKRLYIEAVGRDYES